MDSDLSPVNRRDFFDVDSQRDLIFSNVQKALTDKFPLENQQYQLELADINYDRKKKGFTLAEQKKAILDRSTLDIPIHGTWRLKDKETGEVVSEQRKSIARVPWLTPRGTFIFRGNSFAISNQQRLRPGIYTRKKANGDLEAHVNLIPGSGNGFRMFMEPSTGVFKFNIGQANIPAFSVFKALGVEDQEIKEAWGDKLYAINSAKAKGFQLGKVYSKLADYSTRKQFTDPVLGIRAAFAKMKLDPETSQHTLGEPFDSVSNKALLRTSKKLLNISNNLEGVDDRDSQASQLFFSPEDLIAERITKDAGGMIKQLLWKATNKRSVEGIPSSALSKQIYSTLLSSGLGSAIPEINPLETADQLVAVSRLGEGAISSVDAIPDEARAVSPSQLGLIDLIATPECVDDKTLVMTSTGWKYFTEVDETTKFACNISGQLEFHQAESITREDYSGPMYGVKTRLLDYLVTPNHRIWTRPYGSEGADYRFETADEHYSRYRKYSTGGHSSYKGSQTSFTIPEIDATYLAQFGKSGDRYLPEEVFEWPVEARTKLLEALVLGEARKSKGQQTFCSTSIKLAKGFERLAFGLGYSTSFREEPDKREHVTSTNYCVNLNKFNERISQPKHHYIAHYEGKVYCATVPGGLIYIKRGRGHGHWSGNSLKIGVDTRLAQGTFKGSDNQLYREVINNKGKKEVVRATDLTHRTLAFPGEVARVKSGKSSKVRAMVNGKIRFVDPEAVDYQLPSGNDMFSMTSNLVPGISGIKGGRLLMASKMVKQALPLQTPEAPLVRSGLPDNPDSSYEELYGDKHLFNVRAKSGGYVSKVTPDLISIKYDDGSKDDIELYNSFMFNQKTSLSNIPVVKAGDRFEPGQLLAHSNYTDSNGTTALGSNFRVAFMPFKGNYEDGIVLSESAAKKATSEHMYVTKLSEDDGVAATKNQFLAKFPNKFTKAQLETIDSNGLVKQGTTVNHGDPLVLATRERTPSKGMAILKQQKSWLSDSSRVWDHHSSGVVTDVYKTKSGEIKVAVKSYSPVKIADKLCFSDDTEILTSSGWKLVKDVINAYSQIQTLSPNNEIEWQRLTKIYEYPTCRTMYHFTGPQVDSLVTDNHRVLAAKTPNGQLDLVRADLFELLGYKYFKGQDKHSEWLEVTNVEIINYSGSVHCVEVPNHVVYVRRNGKACWSGNSNRYGGKGVVSHIVPDEKMPRDPETGTPYEVILNPLGIISRCYDDQTEFLTQDGWKFGKDVLDSDQIMQFDPNTKTPQLVKQSAKFHRANYRGKVYCCKNDSTDFKVTPNHSFLVWENFHYRRVKVEELFGKQCTLPSSTNTSDIYNSVNYINIKPDDWFIAGYTGKIYCPTVPSGYVITRRNGKLLVAGNTNPSQLIETVLAKIARKTGKPYNLPAFTEDDYLEFALEELKKNGMSATQLVTDPVTNRDISDVLTGEQFLMKLHHLSEGKLGARDIGGYSLDKTPSRGEEAKSKSKRIGNLEANALIAHGAYETLKDAKLVRGQQNDEFWMDFRTGKQPKVPDSAFINTKFMEMLRAAGVNVQRNGSATSLSPLTDKETDKLAGNRELTSGDAIDLRTKEPVKGGTFDLAKTGGLKDGSKWSKITLAEPMPNPLMEEPIMRLLGLTKPEFMSLLRQPDGSKQIQSRLKSINTDQMIEEQYREIKSGKKSSRNLAVKRLKFLTGLKKAGIKPEELMISKVPVLPPQFRPVTLMKGIELTSDANLLYKDLFEANQDYKDLSGDLDDLSEERMQLYAALKAVSGVGNSINTKHQEKGVQGILKHLLGKRSPKEGVFQRKLISSDVDTVGRAVITPDQTLGMDEVGIPEEAAWTIYRPHIMRRLSRTYNAGSNKVPMTELAKWIQNRDPRAKKALEDELGERPVVISRAPVLHKYGVMGAWPKLVPGNTMRVPASIIHTYGGDFDGNCLDYDEIIHLTLSKSSPIIKEESHSEWFKSLLRRSSMSYLSDEIATLGLEDDIQFSIKIGELPTFGEPIKEITDGKHQITYSLPEGISILTYDHVTQSSKWSPITAFTVDKGHVVCEIEFSNKTKVIASNNESLAVYDRKTGELVRRKPVGAEGMMVPVVRKEPIINPNNKTATFDDGWWLASLISNGWVSNKTVGYAHNDSDMREQFVKLCRDRQVNFDAREYSQSKDDHCNKFGDSCKVHLIGDDIVKEIPELVHSDIQYYSTSGVNADKMLVEPRKGDMPFALTARPALFKYIDPVAVANFGEDAWLGFLCGYLENDGSTLRVEKKGRAKGYQDTARINTSSPYLVEDFKAVFRKLGLRFATGKKPANKQSHPGFSLVISLPDLYKIAHKLKFVSKESSDWLKQFIESGEPKDDRNIIPIPTDVTSCIKSNRQLVGNKLYDLAASSERRGYITRSSAQKLVDECGELLSVESENYKAWKDMITNDDIVWVAVTKVATLEGTRDVFDIEVPETKVFAINNGLIVWDTMNFHVPATEEAIEEIQEKLLPSKNLISAGDYEAHFAPRQEFLFGLYQATQEAKKGPAKVFEDEDAVIKAFLAGKIDVNDSIEIR